MSTLEPPNKRTRSTPEAVSAAYQVVISISDSRIPRFRDSDRLLLSALEELETSLEERLTTLATQQFGPAYFVRLGEARPESSVRLLVLLGVRYPVRITEAVINGFRRFAGQIELAIAEELEKPGPAALIPAPVQVIAALDESSVSAAPESAAATPWERLAPILAAIGTGIGVLGLVTFVGGAIEWGRFHATGLPPEESLSVVPTHDLTVVGARTLVPAFTWGLVASALFLIVRIAAGRHEERHPDPADQTVVELHGDAVRAVLLAVFVATFASIEFFVTLEAPGTQQYLGLVLLGLLMVGLTYSIARITSRFLFLTATIFLSLSIFITGVEYVRARSTPELRGAAIVRNNRNASIGFFIAESSDRVYLARLDLRPLEHGHLETGSARLIGISRGQITDLAIGAPKKPADALAQAQFLAGELCRLEPAAFASQQSPGQTRGQPIPASSDCWGPVRTVAPVAPNVSSIPKRPK